jgi:cysteine desulfurase
MTVSSSKIYGPTGSALLYIKRGTSIEPEIYGGKQELGFRAGTENLTAIAGFAKAVEILDLRRKQDKIHFQKLYNHFIKNLSDKITFEQFGHPRDRIYSVVNIAFDKLSGEDLVAYLDSMGIEVATGAACLVAGEKPSRILLAIGVKESVAQSSLRISFGRETSINDVDILIQGIFESMENLRV